MEIESIHSCEVGIIDSIPPSVVPVGFGNVLDARLPVIWLPSMLLFVRV